MHKGDSNNSKNNRCKFVFITFLLSHFFYLILDLLPATCFKVLQFFWCQLWLNFCVTIPRSNVRTNDLQGKQ